MRKKCLFLLLLIISIFLLGCDSKNQDANEKENEVIEETTINKETEEDTVPEPKEEIKTEEKKEPEKVETKITKNMNNRINTFLKVFPSKYYKVTSNNVDEMDILFVSYYIASDYFHKDTNTGKELKKAVEETFGKNIKYSNKNIDFIYTDETVAFYDKKTDKYTYNVETSHGYYSIRTYDYEISRKRENNKIKVKIKRVYYGCPDICVITEIYRDPDVKKQYKIEDKYLLKGDFCGTDENGNELCEIDVEKYIKDHKNDIPTLTFEFELENNIPVFKRVYR